MDEESGNAETVGNTVAQSLWRALRVAGPQKLDGTHTRLRSTDVQRESGVARSTLRALAKPGDEHPPNPDVRTLARVARCLGVPTAFLLLNRGEWQGVLAAIEDVPTMLAAVEAIETAHPNIWARTTPVTVLEVLRRAGVYAVRVPKTGDQTIDHQLAAEAAERDERLRRAALVLEQLISPVTSGTSVRYSRRNVLVLAAALANQCVATR